MISDLAHLVLRLLLSPTSALIHLISCPPTYSDAGRTPSLQSYFVPSRQYSRCLRPPPEIAPDLSMECHCRAVPGFQSNAVCLICGCCGSPSLDTRILNHPEL